MPHLNPQRRRGCPEPALLTCGCHFSPGEVLPAPFLAQSSAQPCSPQASKLWVSPGVGRGLLQGRALSGGWRVFSAHRFIWARWGGLFSSL